ncbi:hypothetical protein CWI75_14575 [Kineobactrum sediminis]|uniref:Two component regulator three Y domain-containing protein n=1 Tax=Kineobactrum sediminis TaxID=1905677 RepID=A0A2N5XZW1_9GAMM|nr:triple tyrosine motif-containing protein [Kineobactrum sediminis]PLW81684.1 hypothetical protein CWI75_14575 [Kineobactrum sediminis]
MKYRRYYILLSLLISTSAIAESRDLSDNKSNKFENLKIYKNGLSSELAEKSITFFHRDNTGRVWTGTQTGLYLYEGQQTSSFSPKNKNEYFAPALDITGMSEDSAGSIWISTYSSGISKYSEVRKRFERVDFSPRRGVTSLVSMGNSLLVYKEDRFLKVVDTSISESLKWLDSAQTSLGISKIDRFYKTSDNRILALTSDGFLRIDFLSKSIERLSVDLDNKSLNDRERIHISVESLFSSEINSMINESSNRTHANGDRGFSNIGSVTDIKIFRGLIFVGTDSGLFIFDEQIRHLYTFKRENSSLSNDHVTRLFVDNETLWIGTYEGLCFLLSSNFQTINSVSAGINDEVLIFTEDYFSNIWVGTYNGLYVIEKGAGHHVNLVELYPEFSLPDFRIMSIESVAEELWIGTRSSGLHILDLITGTKIHHSVANNDNFEITKIQHLPNETTLIGSYNNGLYRLDPGYDESGGKSYGATKLLDIKVTLIEPIKSKNSVLIGTENKLFFYDLKTDTISEIEVDFGLDDITPIMTVIHETSEGAFWIGTQSHGVYLADMLSPSESVINLKPLFEDTLLSTSAIYSAEIDNNDRTWVSGSEGLFLILADGSFARRFTKLDGLQGNKFNFGSSFKDSNGQLFFGGSRGYNRFNPDSITAYIPRPAIGFTKVTLEKSINNPKLIAKDLQSIILSHKDHFITFEFSALELIDPQSTRYRYKLIGFDPDWIDIGSRRTATYTNLPAGDFEFRVQAVNAAGVWNREGITMDLKVKPAPWLTGWAFTLYGILVVMLIIIWHRIYRAYAIKDEALRHAKKMQDIADRYADDLQEQVEFQGKLTDSFHFYNKELLARAYEGIDAGLVFSLAGEDLSGKRLLRRLRVFDLLQDALYYHGEQLYANLRTFTDHLAAYLEGYYGEAGRKLTVINDIPNDVMPAAHAVSCAIIIAECLDNSLAHAFPAEKAACFVRIGLTTTAEPIMKKDQVVLHYQDNGIGIPTGLAFDAPESGGMTIIASAVASLNGEIGFEENSRTNLLVTFQVPWTREPGSSPIT